MKILWLDDAVGDLQALRRYIARDNLVAAQKMVNKIVDAIEMLSEQPASGRQGRVVHTREWVISGTPYIVPYRVKNNTIEILRIFHCAMRWPDEL